MHLQGSEQEPVNVLQNHCRALQTQQRQMIPRAALALQAMAGQIKCFKLCHLCMHAAYGSNLLGCRGAKPPVYRNRNSRMLAIASAASSQNSFLVFATGTCLPLPVPC